MGYKGRYEYLSNKEELGSEIEEHKKNGSIFKDNDKSEPQKILNFERAENELKHSEAVFKISESKDLKIKLGLLEEDTFYSGTIAHAYYAIFFATKALL